MLPWQRRQRCIIPAVSFDEPCWETGEIVESYTMLTINADNHPIMSRMHKPDPKLPPDQQDKRSVVAIEEADVEARLLGTNEDAARLVAPPSVLALDSTSNGTV